MAENKKTKRMFYEEIVELGKELGKTDLVEFATHEIDLLDRKNSSKRLSKTQIENEKVGQILVEELRKLNRPVTISNLMEESEIVKNYKLENGEPLRNQKISAIFKKLVDNQVIVKTVPADKKKSYFSVN